MSSTDESETLLDHLAERINANGWRVISNLTRQPESNADELKMLIQRIPGRRKSEEPDPPEAA
jgi:hypothetical protein